MIGNFLWTLLLLIICLFGTICGSDEQDQKEDVADFFNMEMGDKSLMAFYYKGGYLSIYEGRNEKLKRYYVTPLTELNSGSAKCLDPEIESRHKIMFDVEMWNPEVVDEAVKALASPPLTLDVRKEHVQPLPILKVRLSAHGLSPVYEPDKTWRSNLNQRLQHSFSIYAANKETCERMAVYISEKPDSFASLIQFEIAMKAEKTASRNVKITGEIIGQSKMFTQLQNMDHSNGDRLLTSGDLNNLAQDIVSSFIASEITTGDYVDEPDEINLARLLEHHLSTETVNTKQLKSDEWKSVFWQEEFVRPDHYTNYLNRAVTFNKSTEKFTYDNETEAAALSHVASDLKRDSKKTNSWSAQAQASFLGFGGGASGSSNNGNSEFSQDKNETDSYDKSHVQMSMDQMQHFLNKNDLQVEWTGDVFVPKSLDLHRINTQQLRYNTAIATQQIQVKTVPITVKLDATVGVSHESDKDHVRILLEQTKRELNESLERITGMIDHTNEIVLNVEENFKEQILAQTAKLRQTNEDLNTAKQNCQQTNDETTKDLHNKTAQLQELILSYSKKIDQNRESIQGLQQHPQIQCETLMTGCTPDTVIHDTKCGEGRYMQGLQTEACPRPIIREHRDRGESRPAQYQPPAPPPPPTLYRHKIICCTT
uniref:Uncharacterized protein n=1 Tax=Plectus sambesii TaxID=2011161 RepID=A0A914VJT9_9BILA